MAESVAFYFSELYIVIRRLSRRTSLDTTMDLLTKPHIQPGAHSAGTLRTSKGKAILL